MKLYEVNTEIQELLEQLELEFDPETGEILGDRTDEILDRLHELEKEKGRILEWIAKEVLNARAGDQICYIGDAPLPRGGMDGDRVE